MRAAYLPVYLKQLGISFRVILTPFLRYHKITDRVERNISISTSTSGNPLWGFWILKVKIQEFRRESFIVPPICVDSILKTARRGVEVSLL